MEADIAAGKDTAFNVMRYGATGFGLLDETAAVQAAADALAAAGGGTLFFPPGTYYIPGAVWIGNTHSHITINGPGATLVKKFAADPSYSFFNGTSGSTKGYGAGCNNITLRNITMQGKFGAGGRVACAMALNHSDWVTVENCKFTQMSGAGHRFDLAGCRFVTFRDCIFEGFDTSYGQYYPEDIQLDSSNATGNSFPEPDTNCFDGLPTVHVTVDNCKWLPLKIGATTYPAANAFGSHGGMENAYNENIIFSNNYVEGSVDDSSQSYTNGALHFVATKNLRIHNNVFVNTGSTQTRAIWCRTTTSVTALVDAGNAGAAAITLTTPYVSSDVVIENNKYIGYKATGTTTPVVNVLGFNGGSRVPVMGVSVSGNRFKDCSASNGVTNNGSELITITTADNVSTDGNRADSCRRLVSLSDSNGFSLGGNVVSNVANSALAFSNCSYGSVSNNIVRAANGTALNSTGVSFTSIVGNTVALTAGVTGSAFSLTTTNVTILDNNISNTGGNTGINLTSPVRTLVQGNLVAGFTTPINPASTTGTLTVQNNVTY